jgi:CheY-like chemotaxis protein
MSLFLIFRLASYEPTLVAVISSHLRGAFSQVQIPISGSPIGHVVITVTDSGPGLSVEQQQALFNQGVQFNPNQLQAGQGSGLGLWISKEIVSLHHGTILVTSEGLGCGSTFEVTIPVVLREMDIRLHPPTTRMMLSSSPPQTPHTVQGRYVSSLSTFHEPVPNPDTNPRARHVLVVDDAPSNRKLVSRLLKAKGYICHEAENGADCVKMVLSGEHPYELILMDYEMPVLNGPLACQQLRDHRCDLLIIGVTGNVLPEDKAYFIGHGANAVLTKPLNLPELLELIESHQISPLSRV